MKRIFRFLGAIFVIALALVVVATTALYFIGKHDIAAQRSVCAQSESFVAIRSKLNDAFKRGAVDQPVIDHENKFIAKAEDACALGEKDKANAILFGVMMDSAFQSDNVYARKVNAQQGRDIPKSK